MDDTTGAVLLPSRRTHIQLKGPLWLFRKVPLFAFNGSVDQSGLAALVQVLDLLVSRGIRS